MQAPTLGNIYHSLHCAIFVILFIVLCTRRWSSPPRYHVNCRTNCEHLFQLLFHGQHRGPLPQLRLPRDPLLLHGLLRHQPPRWDSALYITELRVNLQKPNHRWEKWSSYAFFQCLLVWNMLVTKICSMWRWHDSSNHDHLCFFWQIFVYQTIQATSSVFDLSNKGEIQTRQMKWNQRWREFGRSSSAPSSSTPCCLSGVMS